MLDKYINFLEHLMGSLNNYFNAQAPYIKCTKGCAKSCSNGDYPFSEIELKYLKQGFNKLDEITKSIILKNIKKIKEDKAKHINPKIPFTYPCPFLINNVCSVYEQRGIICRTFGLIYLKKDSKNKLIKKYLIFLTKKYNKIESC